MVDFLWFVPGALCGLGAAWSLWGRSERAPRRVDASAPRAKRHAEYKRLLRLQKHVFGRIREIKPGLVK